MGIYQKKISKFEKENKKIVRKSIYASKSIEKGELLSEDNLICLRPDTGISAIYWRKIIGKKSIKKFKKYEKIKI